MKKRSIDLSWGTSHRTNDVMSHDPYAHVGGCSLRLVGKTFQCSVCSGSGRAQLYAGVALFCGRLSTTFSMVVSCCAVGCTKRAAKGSGVGFFRFPKENTRRKAWVQAVRREKWQPSDSSRICGLHFITGAPSPFPNHPDWAPNVFAFKKANREAEEKKCDRYERTLKRKRCSGKWRLRSRTVAASCRPAMLTFRVPSAEVCGGLSLSPKGMHSLTLHKITSPFSHL